MEAAVEKVEAANDTLIPGDLLRERKGAAVGKDLVLGSRAGFTRNI